MPPFFTVVIVNYNSGGCLARCLEALEAQRFRDFTVIVVDNGSTDDSLQALDKIPPAWQAIRLGRNTGFAAANNHAFAQFNATISILAEEKSSFHLRKFPARSGVVAEHAVRGPPSEIPA